MADALSCVDPKRIKSEIAQFAPSRALRILAKAGIRDEHVFPVPAVLAHKPTLIGYYRLLLGIPQKTFYGSGTGMLQFKSMEEHGTLTDKQQAALPQYCRLMCDALGELVRELSPSITQRDVDELPLLTLGQRFQGANNNKIGQEAKLTRTFLARFIKRSL